MKKIFFTYLALSIFIPLGAFAGSISIGTITPNADVAAGTNISFPIIATDVINPRYILSDSLPGSTASNSSISSSGRFNWTPSQLDIGTHILTITALDSLDNRTSTTQTLTVRPPSPTSIQNLYPGSSIFPDNTLSFNVAALGFVNPFFTVSDSFPGSTINSSNITSGGNFSWVPKKSDIGVHNISIRISSPSGRSENVYQTVVVNGIAIKNISSTRLQVGSTLTFDAITHGIDSPAYRVTDEARNNTIDSITINGNSFRWTPTSRDIGTHTITVAATDIDGNVRSNQLTVTVESDTPVTTPTPSTPTTSTPPSTNSYIFTTDLKTGSNGTAVIELQKRLKTEGFFSGPTNGNFGPQTKAAVIKYQKAKGISAIGVVGPATRNALNKR